MNKKSTWALENWAQVDVGVNPWIQSQGFGTRVMNGVNTITRGKLRLHEQWCATQPGRGRFFHVMALSGQVKFYFELPADAVLFSLHRL